jgi:gamma-glutamyltranspeptidase / glutathione hydrolase
MQIGTFDPGSDSDLLDRESETRFMDNCLSRTITFVHDDRSGNKHPCPRYNVLRSQHPVNFARGRHMSDGVRIVSRGSGDSSQYRRVLALLVLLFCAGCSDSNRSEGVPPYNQKPDGQVAERYMVSAANPHAVEIGLAVLRAGGHAVDAAVAVQMVLGFVEAPETGIGGGGFLLFREGSTGEITVYDGREKAPQGADPDRFQVFGIPMPRWAALVSGQSVGVPGLVAMLHQAHREHGRMPWSELIEPAIILAENGVPMPRRLQEQIARDYSLRLFPATRKTFVRQWRQDEPVMINRQLARTLRILAEGGKEAFYRGPIAAEIMAAARNRWLWPSDMTPEDLHGYSAEKRQSVCGKYRRWTVCGVPPPSSGGIAVLQVLGILEHFDLRSLEPGSAESIHLIAEASRLAFADRDYYVGDPDFVEVPIQTLLDSSYLAQRAGLIRPERALKEVRPGGTEVGVAIHAVANEDGKSFNTSHFTIVDSEGNAVALTGSIEAPFGSRIMAGGFLLNNQLTDFTFRPQIDGRDHPNAVAPGKRPRSSMSPVIVLDEAGDIRLVIGSRGGSRIIGYVVKAIIGVLDWELSVQEAIALPNFVHRGVNLEIEKGTELQERVEALEALGHRVRVGVLTSGLHGIERIDAQWRGGADPRLDGVALGD